MARNIPCLKKFSPAPGFKLAWFFPVTEKAAESNQTCSALLRLFKIVFVVDIHKVLQ
jgi:hypothetical protein